MKFENNSVEEFLSKNPAENAALKMEWEITKLDTVDYTKSRNIPTSDTFYQAIKDQQVNKNESIFKFKKISVSGTSMKVSYYNCYTKFS